MYDVPVYIIGMPSGQFDEEGVELIILIDVKLSKLAAEQVQQQNPGSVIEKRVADKRVP